MSPSLWSRPRPAPGGGYGCRVPPPEPPTVSVRPSVASPAVLFGLFSLIYGISQIVLGAQLRPTEHAAQELTEQAA